MTLSDKGARNFITVKFNCWVGAFGNIKSSKKQVFKVTAAPKFFTLDQALPILEDTLTVPLATEWSVWEGSGRSPLCTPLEDAFDRAFGAGARAHLEFFSNTYLPYHDGGLRKWRAQYETLLKNPARWILCGFLRNRSR